MREHLQGLIPDCSEKCFSLLACEHGQSRLSLWRVSLVLLLELKVVCEQDIC